MASVGQSWQLDPSYMVAFPRMQLGYHRIGFTQRHEHSGHSIDIQQHVAIPG